MTKILAGPATTVNRAGWTTARTTGILVIRNKVRSQYNPLPLLAYFPVLTSSYAPTIGGVPWSQRATGPVETYNIGNVIQSCGSKHSPLINSLGAACDMWDQIGRQTIQDYILGLANYLKESIVARFGGVSALYAPKDDPELVSARRGPSGGIVLGLGWQDEPGNVTDACAWPLRADRSRVAG